MSGIKVSELMVDIFDFPHIPYWFAIRQAVTILRMTMSKDEKCSHPIGVLVFDEKYSLLGFVGIYDLLKGLDSSLSAAGGGTEISGAETAYCDIEKSREAAERPVSEVMTPAEQFVSPDDPIEKAAGMMVNAGLMFLPVFDVQKKLIGILKTSDVFDRLADSILE